MSTILEKIDQEFGQIIITTPKPLIEQIDDFAAKNGFRSRAECVRRILDTVVNGNCDLDFTIKTTLKNGRRL